jgi:hypothetical protein
MVAGSGAEDFPFSTISKKLMMLHPSIFISHFNSSRMLMIFSRQKIFSSVQFHIQVPGHDASSPLFSSFVLIKSRPPGIAGELKAT